MKGRLRWQERIAMIVNALVLVELFAGMKHAHISPRSPTSLLLMLATLVALAVWTAYFVDGRSPQ